MDTLTINELVRSFDPSDFLPSGWFDPRFCITLLTEFPEIKQTGDELELISSPRETEAIKSKMRNILVPPDIHAGKLFEDYYGIVYYHEYFHFLQFIRSISSPMLIWSFVEMFSTSKAILEYFKDIRIQLIELPISKMTNIDNLWWFWKNIWWFYSKQIYLSTFEIIESEAELLSLMRGENVYRFRKYMIGNPVTIHFRDLAESNPLYGRAYLQAESSLNILTPSLFPLVAYFALSMPWVPSKEEFDKDLNDYSPVSSEEAFQAALDYLSNDISAGYDYYFYAYDLYKHSDIKISRKNCPIEEFCKKVCKFKGWEYSSLERRLKWIRLLKDRGFILTDKISELLMKAIELENEYGAIIFVEPFNTTIMDILKTLPLPLIIISRGDQKYDYLAHNFWGSTFSEMIFHIRALIGASFAMFSPKPIRSLCPHARKCKFNKADLCNSFLGFPNDPEDCSFPSLFFSSFGIPAERFYRSIPINGK